MLLLVQLQDNLIFFTKHTGMKENYYKGKIVAEKVNTEEVE
jgi:hypothetical protein